MDSKFFKKTNKPAACTSNPFEALIPFEIRQEVLLKIRQESIDTYGENLVDECKNRLVCLGKSCLGRPLAITPTSQKYIDQLAKTQKVKNGKLYISTNCNGCPIFSSCSNPCNQINDFLERDRLITPGVVYAPLNDNIPIEPSTVENSTPIEGKIPWDCLNEVKAKVVRLYLYEQKDFNHIANILNLNSQAETKQLFYSALTKLSKYAIMRKYIETYAANDWLLNKVYVENLTITKAAALKGVSKQAASAEIKRFIKIHKIKWKKFLYKRGGKLIYNVPMLMK